MTRPTDPLDTWLLRVLVTLLLERSVSRTAIKLHQSQPAISAALKRLRAIFGDELLVRDKRGMVATARGIELMAPARVALAEIDRLLAQPESFDPSHSRQMFCIGMPDYLATTFLAGVVAIMRSKAPGARLNVHGLGQEFDYERALADGHLDVVIGNWPEPPAQLHLAVLFEDEVVCLMCRNHPLAKKGLTAQAYLRASHIVPTPYSPMQRGVVDTRLATLRLSREARVMLPFFNVAPYLLPRTDLLFTTARHFAEHYARLLPLAILPAAIDFPRMRFYQLWHDRTHHSSAHRWLRGLLNEAGRSIGNDRLAKGGR
jgi:DNA-binding transcriptional LysR family regulator